MDAGHGDASATAEHVIIVPGYGMALAQAQFEVAALVQRLEQHGQAGAASPSTRSPAGCRAT